MINAEKERLPKGRSWILKTSLLEQALADARIEVDVHLIYRTPQIDGSILEAFYWMPNSNVTHRRLYVRAGSLTSDERTGALKHLIETAIPALVEWVAHLERQPDDAPVLHAEPYFDARYLDGHLRIVREPAA